jgi:hypothetical protein
MGGGNHHLLRVGLCSGHLGDRYIWPSVQGAGVAGSRCWHHQGEP